MLYAFQSWEECSDYTLIRILNVTYGSMSHLWRDTNFIKMRYTREEELKINFRQF